MDKIELESTQFKKFSGTTRDLISMGVWLLYGISYPKNPDAKYILITDTMRYITTEDGTILEKCVLNPEGLECISTVTFSDIITPAANCNIQLEWA